MYGALSGDSFFNGTAYIVNEDDDGAYARLLIERLDAQEGLEVQLLTALEANAKLERSDLFLVSFIPEDFSERLESGWSTHITFRQRGNGGMEGQIAAGMVRAEADAISQEVQAQRQVQLALGHLGVQPDAVETTVRGLLARERLSPLVTVEERFVGVESGMVQLILPGIITMFALFSITMSSRVLVEERRKGTLERLLTTRLSVNQLYAGKFMSGVTRGFLQTFILLSLSFLIFRLASPTTFLVTLLVALVFTAAASALGLLIGSVARTEDQAIGLSIGFTMATVMLGGTFFEIPETSWIGTLGAASINTYANGALKTLLMGSGQLADVSFELAVLAVTAMAALLLSRLLFRTFPGGR